jgi:DNA-directed RNA polymerase II subunit RPB2
MTIGQLVECLTGKVSSIAGSEGDGTAFNTHITVDRVASVLHSQGYQRHGNETLHSGFTGRPLTAKIFMGPTFYQRLKHLVDDKIHSRARGPVRSSGWSDLGMLLLRLIDDVVSCVLSRWRC